MDPSHTERRYLETNGARLRLCVFGHGPVVVLLHGGPGVADYFGDSVLVEWLAGRFTVCTYDQRGCRNSASDGPFNLEANVDDLEAVRASLGAPRIILIGHSWGAFLALYYASRHSQAVSRLVLLSPVPPRSGWQRERSERLEANHTEEQRAELARIDATIARTRNEREREELYRRRFNVALPSYLARAHRDKAPRIEWYSRRINTETMSDVHRACASPSWEAGLRDYRAPTLVLHGREDIIPFSAVRRIRSLVPHARLVGLDDCGHFPWLETPEPLRQVLLRFLVE